MNILHNWVSLFTCYQGNPGVAKVVAIVPDIVFFDYGCGMHMHVQAKDVYNELSQAILSIHIVQSYTLI